MHHGPLRSASFAEVTNHAYLKPLNCGFASTNNEDHAMTATKYLFAMLVAAIRKELTIQSVAPIQRQSASQKIQENKILKNGLNGFAMFGLITLVMAIWIL